VVGLITGLIAAALVLSLVVGTVRIAGRKGRPSRLSGAAGTWLADLNALLQPQQPTPEAIQKAKEQGEEDDDEADDRDPPELIALGFGDHPDDGLRFGRPLTDEDRRHLAVLDEPEPPG
jgi:hypothetical protein